jgi:hypothetical protein
MLSDRSRPSALRLEQQERDRGHPPDRQQAAGDAIGTTDRVGLIAHRAKPANPVTAANTIPWNCQSSRRQARQYQLQTSRR